MKGNPYGSHRVISPVGLLPQAAERVNNDPVICDNEILIAVEALQPTATAFGRIRKECGGDTEQMKAEIKAIKESRNLDAIPDGISEKKKVIAAYMREHPEVTSKSAIAKAVGTDRNTVRKYYDEIRSEWSCQDFFAL